MDFKKSILLTHSRSQATKIADYVGASEARFGKLIGVFMGGPYRITQRAAWPLNICVERHPGLLLPHLKKILAHLRSPEAQISVIRNVVRMLQFVDIPPPLQGNVLDICLTFLQSRETPVAVKVFSMTVAANIAQREPSLARELRLIIGDQISSSSPSFVSRARKVLRTLAMVDSPKEPAN